MEKGITICTDSESVIATLAADKAKTLLVANCIIKLIQLSEMNRVTTVWITGQAGMGSCGNQTLRSRTLSATVS